MIRLNNINKYYNKGKVNENHVLKDINLEIPESGFVMILGSSGSGKTTLLNVISGIDSFDSGSIIFNNKKISKYKAKVWDKIRNDNMGYVFQDFNLIQDLTVFENIEMNLKFSGIDDSTEIKNRVSYLLKVVGLENYENRLVKSLSGGQAQRVNLVRALAKDPKILICDEPTGNLDSKNTIIVMNVLKAISKDRLVIMVSHDNSLAEYYSDRIIRLKDGDVISDKEHNFTGVLSKEEEHKIFLKEFNKGVSHSNNITLESFNDGNEEPLDIKVINKGQNIYLKAKSNKRIKLLDEDSEIEVIDDYLENKDKYSKIDFDYENHINNVKKKRFSYKESIKYVIRRLVQLSLLNRMYYIILILVGGLISLSVGIYGEVNDINEAVFIDKSTHYLIVEGDYKYEEAKSIEELDFVKDISFFTESVSYDLMTEKYYQINDTITLDAHPSDVTLLDEEDIIFGRYPSEREIVIDKLLANRLLFEYSNRGLKTYEDILKSSIKLQANGTNFSLRTDSFFKFDIVGISNDNSPTIWMHDKLLYSLSMPNLVDYELFKDNIMITDGEFPKHISEALRMGYDQYQVSSVGTELGTIDITGSYAYMNDNGFVDTKDILISDYNLMHKLKYVKSSNNLKGTKMLAYVEDPNEGIEKFKELDINAYSDYLDRYEKHIEKQLEEKRGFYLYAVIGVLSSSVGIYFIMRSSLLSRLYEIRVLRSIGARKNDIRRIFFVEIVIITIICSMLGYFVTMLVLNSGLSNAYINYVHYTPINIIVGLLVLFIVNISLGLLPIELLIRKTPAELSSKYDI